MSSTESKKRSAAAGRRKRLGAKIRRLRTERGYTIESFAHALGYSWITVSRYERGISQISPDRLHTIADVLDVPFADLVDAGTDGRRVA